MRRFTIIAICLLALASLTAGTAWAGGGSPHYLNKNTTVTFNTDNSITVKWKEAGLDTLDIPYVLSAFVNATWFCRTNSGNIPNAANKTTFSGNATSSGVFHAENGNIVGTLILSPPAAPVSSPPTCGNGQTLDLQSITYDTPAPGPGNPCGVSSGGVTLCDTSHLLSLSVGTFSRTIFPAP